LATAPTEYLIKYKYTGKNNTLAGVGSKEINIKIDLSMFEVSGNTQKKIGAITRIEFKHYHTIYGTATWDLYGRLICDSKPFDSDVVSLKSGASVSSCTNTFTGNLPSPEEFEKATQIQIISKACSSKYSYLYWRATKDAPMEINVYFFDQDELVKDAVPPKIKSVSHKDIESHNALGHFGKYVKSWSRPAFTVEYELDPRYSFMTATQTLQLMNQYGNVIYSATQVDNNYFEVGTINESGTIAWSYTLVDSAGKDVSDSGTFDVADYSSPSLKNVSVERYNADVDDGGQSIYIPSDDGDYVRFTLDASTKPVENNNGWKLELTYSEGDSDTSTKIDVVSGDDGADISYENDRTILPAIIDSASNWDFSFKLSDYFTSTTVTVSVLKAGAYFDVEPVGVSVGMRSTGTEEDKKFEVDGEYGTYLYGGIKEVRDLENSQAALGIFSGKVNNVAIASNGSSLTSIKFSNKYISTPVIICGLASSDKEGNTNTNIGQCSVYADDISAIGFTLKIVNKSSAAVEMGAHWMSIGQPNTDPDAKVIITVKRPVANMTSNNSVDCIASASSTLSSAYPAWKAFDSSLGASWVSANNTSDLQPWISLHMTEKYYDDVEQKTKVRDFALKNIKMSVYSRTGYTINPEEGVVEGSNDGENWTELASFKEWSTSASGSLLGVINCNNTTAYSYVRLHVTKKPYNQYYIAIGNIKITGEIEA